MSATLKRRAAARRLQKQGRGGDTLLAHINPREAELLHRATDGGAVNPKTGLLEFDEHDPGEPGVAPKPEPDERDRDEPSVEQSVEEWADLVEAATGATEDQPPPPPEAPDPQQYPNPEDLTSRAPYNPTPFAGVTADDNGPTGFGPLDSAIENPIETGLNVIGGALMPLVSIYNLGVGVVNWLAGTNIPSAGGLVTGAVGAVTGYEPPPPTPPRAPPVPPPQPWGASDPTEQQVAYTATENQAAPAGGNGLLSDYPTTDDSGLRDQDDQAGIQSAQPAVDVPVAPPPTSGVAPVQAAPPVNTGLLSAATSGFTNRPGLRPTERFDPDYYRTGSWSFDPATSKIKFTPRA